MIIVCFDHDNFIGNVVMGCLFPMWKEDIEKHIPTNCSHYDIVTEQEYEKKNTPMHLEKYSVGRII